MGLVDYSDSESESESPTTQPTKPTIDVASKKSSSNPIARSSTGKILVSLPASSAANPTQSDEPPSKRARVGAGPGSSRFSNFGAFLPPPKAVKPVAPKGAAPRPGVHLKTGAEPAFSRETDPISEEGDALSRAPGSGLSLPSPKVSSGPTIPEGQKPEEEVKLVGKPLMFKPLSVGRKPTKKKRIIPGAVPKQPAPTGDHQGPVTSTMVAPEEPAKKKVSLFSMDDEAPSVEPVPQAAATYEPLFGVGGGEEDGVTEPYPTDTGAAFLAQQDQLLPSRSAPQSLSIMADDLNLSKKARRELFGRNGPGSGGAKIVNFNMEREYAHNEAVRASGEQQAYNPVRAIAPGKHNLRQLVDAAQNNQSALEDSFAANKSSKREAGSRYGWG
ncbi:hypothetical protein GQ53DRAFT_156217 [Thozetella sp. PMI_491]|nr:hypothetical protein GQ53DRAFT_156217 [Thozetella sp. PMI_491]